MAKKKTDNIVNENPDLSQTPESFDPEIKMVTVIHRNHIIPNAPVHNDIRFAYNEAEIERIKRMCEDEHIPFVVKEYSNRPEVLITLG